MSFSTYGETGTRTLRGVLTACLLLASGAAPLACRAPDSSGKRGAPVEAKLPAGAPLAGVDIPSLQRGSWTYKQTLTRNGKTQPWGFRRIDVDTGTWNGEPVWFVIERQATVAQNLTDTAILRRDDLVALARRGYVLAGQKQAKLELTFSIDSVRGSIGSDGNFRQIVMPRSQRLVGSEAAAQVLMGIAPLNETWKDSLQYPQASTSKNVAVNLSVDGRAPVVTDAGKFDSWSVHATTADADQRLYVVAGQPPVRIISRLAVGNAMLEQALLGDSSAAVPIWPAAIKQARRKP